MNIFERCLPHNFKNKLALGLAATALVLMFAGCDANPSQAITTPELDPLSGQELIKAGESYTVLQGKLIIDGVNIRKDPKIKENNVLKYSARLMLENPIMVEGGSTDKSREEKSEWLGFFLLSQNSGDLGEQLWKYLDLGDKYGWVAYSDETKWFIIKVGEIEKTTMKIVNTSGLIEGQDKAGKKHNLGQSWYLDNKGNVIK